MRMDDATVYEYTNEDKAYLIARGAMGRFIDNKIVKENPCGHEYPNSWKQFADEFEGVAIEVAVTRWAGIDFDLVQARKGKLDLPGIEIKGNAFPGFWSTLIRPHVLEPLVQQNAIIISGWINPIRSPAACYMGQMMAAEVEAKAEWFDKQKSWRIGFGCLEPLTKEVLVGVGV